MSAKTDAPRGKNYEPRRDGKGRPPRPNEGERERERPIARERDRDRERKVALPPAPREERRAGPAEEGAERPTPVYHRSESCGPDGTSDDVSLREALRRNGVHCDYDMITEDTAGSLRRLEEARNKACTCARERMQEAQRIGKVDKGHEFAIDVTSNLCKVCNKMIEDLGGTPIPLEDARVATTTMTEVQTKATASPSTKPAVVNSIAWMWLRHHIEQKLQGLPLDEYPTVAELTEDVREYLLQQPLDATSPGKIWLDVSPLDLRVRVSELLTFFRARKTIEDTQQRILNTKRRRKSVLTEKKRLLQSMQKKVHLLQTTPST